MNEIILELRDEASYFEHEDIGWSLSAESLAVLRQKSFALHEVQKRRFRKLDEGLRKVLGYASYQGMRFLRQMVLDVAQLLDAQQAPEADADRLSRAVQPYAVLMADSAFIYEFRHRVFYDLARERIDRLPDLAPSLSKALLQICGDWLDGGAVGPLSAAEREAFYLLMLEQRLALTDAAFPHLRLRLIAGLFNLYHQTGYLAKALDWSEQLASELPADGRIATDMLSLGDQLAIVYVWLELDRRDACETLARGLVETCRARVAQPGVSAGWLRDVSAAEVGLGDVLLRADQPDKARELYEKSLATCERIVTEFGETAERLRDVSVSQDRVGDVLLRADQPDQVRELYEKSLATRERIVTEFGETAERLRDVAVSLFRLGNLARQTGDLVLARERLAASESGLATLAARLETASAQADLDLVRRLIADLERAGAATAQSQVRPPRVVSENAALNDPRPCGSGTASSREGAARCTARRKGTVMLRPGGGSAPHPPRVALSKLVSVTSSY